MSFSGCWVYPGCKKNGYGTGWDRTKVVRTHRAAYEALVGPIPEGMDLDHLCRNRACYNPAHLEPVTRSENLRRSNLVGKWQAQKTHCPDGHPYDGANLYITASGGRSCRACKNRQQSEYYFRKKAS